MNMGVNMSVDISSQQLEEEKVRVFIGRAEAVSSATRRRKMAGAILLAIGAFLLIVSWVMTGLTMIYVVLGAVGAASFGLGGYYLLTEPALKVWLTLIDEVEQSLKTAATEEELRGKIQDAIRRHKDEPVLARRVTETLGRYQGEELRDRLKMLVTEYRKIG